MIAFWVVTCIVLLFGFVVAFGAPYVPSLKKEVRNAFVELYPLSKGDAVVDLGSGDGSVLLEAAKRGAVTYGYELNPVLVAVSWLRLRRYRSSVRLANMWNVTLPNDTTLVYCFIVTRDSKRLTTMLQKEATRLNRPLTVMTFGATLHRLPSIGQRKAHSLYEIRPLQA